ncbi:hypothetical protein LXL04_026657 [Taraxacum kok-saghyz]
MQLFGCNKPPAFLPLPFASLQNLCSGSPPTIPKIYVPSNLHGAESLPPGIVVPETNLYLRRLWGEPNEMSLQTQMDA